MEIDMENDIVKNITDELSNLSIKILDYIESTENWIFYWIEIKNYFIKGIIVFIL